MHDMEPAAQTDASQFEGDLDAFVAAFDRANRAHVIKVLKSSPFETTELIELDGGDYAENPINGTGSRFAPEAGDGPQRYIKKTLDCSAGTGGAYEALWRAQQKGACLTCAPRLLSCARTGDILTVVMEYVNGPTLAQAVARQGGSIAYTQAVFPLLCRAVEELHQAPEAPIIHRDLKPSNIVISENGPVIIDFGIAREWREGAEADTSHFGTRCYAPPEQFGFGQTDIRSDVYALGKILFFCLTGSNPANVATAEMLAEDGVPPACAQVIVRATAFDPAIRYGDARQLALAAGIAFEKDLQQASAESTWDDSAAAGFARVLCRALASVPDALGIVWNVLMLIGLVLVGGTCFYLVANPVARDVGTPLWFRVVAYIVFFAGTYACVCFCLLDKRRLRRRFPTLCSLSIPRQIVLCAAYACVSFALFVVAVCVSGV